MLRFALCLVVALLIAAAIAWAVRRRRAAAAGVLPGIDAVGFDPISNVLSLGQTLIERLIPDKAAQEAAKAQLVQMQIAGDLAQYSQQVEVDKAEAANASVFVAGWRPFIGWICGAALAYQFILRPLLNFSAPYAMILFHAKSAAPVAPGLEMDSLMTLLLGMLGLGAMRTVEKVQGLNPGH